jgi:phage regulator Rha-like protein
MKGKIIMTKQDFISEHRRLIKELKSKGLIKESNKQLNELKKYHIKLNGKT